jgi:crotonobetainyl-CoA:carnitine CoA-transferase CaiB-like acyl-CoA transferase
MDHTGGYYGAMAMLAALLYRRRTGRGQHVDLSQTEAAITLTGTAILDYTVNGRPSARQGNRNLHPPYAPHGVYRSAPDPTGLVGDDEWLAIAVTSEAQWHALCDVAQRPSWRDDPRFATLETRLQHQEELDCEIGAWTRSLTNLEAMQALQAAGVPAGRVQRSRELMDDDPQLAHRGVYPTVQHPVLGARRIDGLPLTMSRFQPSYEQGAPLLGRDNAYVFGDLLGLPAEEIGRLEAEMVLW